jgi:thiol-disulfide isomerase/thioredoxin
MSPRKNRRNLFLGIALAAALLAILAGAVYFGKVAPFIKAGKQESSLLVESARRPVDAFSFETRGGIQRLSDLKGKVVMIDVWASWCPPCIQEIPYLASLQSRYRDRPFELIALSVDDDGWNALNPFLQTRPEISYTVAVPHPALGWHVGTLFDLAPLGEVAVLPTVFLIDRKGRLAGKFVGAGRTRETEALLEKLLSEIE